MSAPGEYHLAVLAGWSGPVAALMPLCLSVYAAAAAVIAATRSPGEPGRRSAVIGAGAALVLALAAQVVAHLIAAGFMTSSAALVAAVSAVPPLVVAHMLHLAASPRPAPVATAGRVTVPATDTGTADRPGTVTATDGQQAPSTDTQDQPADPAPADDTPATIPATVSAPATTARGSRPSGRPAPVVDLSAVRAAVDDLSASGVRPTGRALGERLGVSERTARRYLAAVA
ncbi:hypothetical protein [Streptomyces spiralis]